ncbi:uncharacterized protein LOC124389594 [Silurus meridionalis]|uniref:uncharacterized protein LOC124389594 n=1 Tax=Silurus meridionalis TaxID=175797 RepID=UPI001EEBDB19|nr:uncharacterized protein LOC124389594 [Silurus meridionalis]
MAPPRLPPRTTQLGILRRQFRQFQLSLLAAELTHFLEHLSSPSVPEDAFLPPRIVQSTSTRDKSTQTSPELNSRHGCSYFPDTTPQFSPYPSHWSPTDYSPTSPVALPSHRAPVPSPGFGPSRSFMSPAHASVSSPGLGPSYSYMSPAAAEGDSANPDVLLVPLSIEHSLLRKEPQMTQPGDCATCEDSGDHLESTRKIIDRVLNGV